MEDAPSNWLMNRRSPAIAMAINISMRRSLLLQSREKLADNSFLIAATSLDILPAEQHTAYEQCHNSKYNTQGNRTDRILNGNIT